MRAKQLSVVPFDDLDDREVIPGCHQIRLWPTLAHFGPQADRDFSLFQLVGTNPGTYFVNLRPCTGFYVYIANFP